MEMAFMQMPHFTAAAFAFSAINGVIVGAVSSLIGSSTSTLSGILIGAIGGGITGVSYGVFFYQLVQLLVCL
jgi:hypothetical protein